MDNELLPESGVGDSNVLLPLRLLLLVVLLRALLVPLLPLL